MRITRFLGENIRNISSLDVTPAPSVNLILGLNGAGKTALLEGLYLLGNGKSFRTNRVIDLLRTGQERVTARGEFLDETDAQPGYSVKVSKSKSDTSISVNEESVSNASTLSRLVPMLLVGASSFGVVEGGPKIRRALIDRVAFHVEPDFLFSLRLLNEALEQRNAVLRRSGGGSEIQFWENQIEIHANRISDIRQDCISRLNNLLRDNTRKGLERGSISLRYRRGWADGRNLAEVLKENRRRDFATGSTTAGPQRAEIEIRVAETLAARVASRGQIKTIVVSIVCELLRLIASKRGNRPMLLLDDIAAELDEAAVSEALDSIRDTGAQVFITALNDNLRTHLDSSSDKAFHVKRGLVDETTTTSR